MNDEQYIEMFKKNHPNTWEELTRLLRTESLLVSIIQMAFHAGEVAARRQRIQPPAPQEQSDE